MIRLLTPLQWIGVALLVAIAALGSTFPIWAPSVVDNPDIVTDSHAQDVADEIIVILKDGGFPAKPFVAPQFFVTNCELMQSATICARSSDTIENTRAIHISTRLPRACRDYVVAFELTRYALFKQGFVHGMADKAATPTGMVRAMLWQSEVSVAAALIYGIDHGIPRCKPPRSTDDDATFAAAME